MVLKGLNEDKKNFQQYSNKSDNKKHCDFIVGKTRISEDKTLI